MRTIRQAIGHIPFTWFTRELYRPAKDGIVIIHYYGDPGVLDDGFSVRCDNFCDGHVYQEDCLQDALDRAGWIADQLGGWDDPHKRAPRGG